MRSRFVVPLLALPVAVALPVAAIAVPNGSFAPGATGSAQIAKGGEAASVITGRIIDRKTVQCSASSQMISKLERDGNRLEVDAEVFGPARQAWTIKFKQNGTLAHTIKRTADGDGELDVWRYLPNTPGKDKIRVKARSSSGELCSARLRG